MNDENERSVASDGSRGPVAWAVISPVDGVVAHVDIQRDDASWVACGRDVVPLYRLPQPVLTPGELAAPRTPTPDSGLDPEWVCDTPVVATFHRDGQIIQQLAATLSDEERAAAGSAVMTFDSLGMMDAANVLRKLLERTK